MARESRHINVHTVQCGALSYSVVQCGAVWCPPCRDSFICNMILSRNWRVSHDISMKQEIGLVACVSWLIGLGIWCRKSYLPQHMNESCHIWMSHVTLMTKSHIWMSHVTYEWVTSHSWLSHKLIRCLTHKCIMPHIWMRHVTYKSLMSHLSTAEKPSMFAKEPEISAKDSCASAKEPYVCI